MLEKYALFRVLKTILDNPQDYSVRGLSKQANVGLGTAKTSLDFLFEKKLLNKKVVGKTYQFSLNKESVLLKYLKITKSLNEIQDSGLINELLKKYPGIISVVLYGSLARGEDTPASDIDLLVIATKKFKLTRLKSEDTIKRELTFLVYDQDLWRIKHKEDKVFYDRVILDGIALYGEIPILN